MMSYASSCCTTVISERSDMLGHLPCWHPTLAQGQGREYVQEIRIQVPINLPGGSLSLFDSKIGGGKEDIGGMLEWSSFL